MPIENNLYISEYVYDLPNEKIALFPAEPRDSSKLLYYHKGNIETRIFKELPGLLPKDSIMVFNNTRVVQARIEFFKATGARVEVFCLEPHLPVTDVQRAFSFSPPVIWKCFIGNAKKWKNGILEKSFQTSDGPGTLFAEKLEAVDDAWLVRFYWEPEDLSLAEVLELAGNTPIPPYIEREAVQADKSTYQTIYAEHNGSVAAPTAGLHFTPEVLSKLKDRGVLLNYVTLHVGAGTFKPVSSPDVRDHLMHSEQLVVSIETIQWLYDNLHKQLIPVGTTSVRTLESIYWHGVMILEKRTSSPGIMNVLQWEPYHTGRTEIPVDVALKAVIHSMSDSKISYLSGSTSLLIAPGYQFKLVKGLVTNFHQPGSTLLLLVGALIGHDWKKVYQYALDNEFRFLSYGDSCLLMP